VSLRVHSRYQRRLLDTAIGGCEAVICLAVVTEQVASSFVGQGASRARPAPQDGTTGREVTMAELDQRLARIERLLTAAHPGNSPGATGGD
jgi:hypothetical protein